MKAATRRRLSKMTKEREKEQTVKLDTLKNMAYTIAEKSLDLNGYYFCNIDDKKTEVVY